MLSINNDGSWWEVEGKVAKKSIYVLIDPRSSHSYVTSKVVESCSLRKMGHDKSWMF